jgi:hypothetical protein
MNPAPIFKNVKKRVRIIVLNQNNHLNWCGVKLRWFAILCSLIPLFVSAFEPSLSKSDRENIDKSLQAQGITEQELSFEKKYSLDSVFRLKIVSDLMDNPLKTPDYLDVSVNKIDSVFSINNPEQVSSLFSYLSRQIDNNVTQSDIKKLDKDVTQKSMELVNSYSSLPKELAQPVALILSGYTIGDQYLKQAFKELTKDEINKILIMAPILWSDEDDTLQAIQKGALHQEFNIAVDTTPEVEIDTILAIAQKVDRRSLALASCAVALGVDKAKEILTSQEYFEPIKPNTVQGIKGSVLFYEETEWGKIVIGSEEDNVYQGDYSLIIDLGGNDKYEGRAGCGIGILSNPFGVVIDLKGNDIYDSPNKFFNFGSGLFGCGLILDLAGNDYYNGYDNCLATGFFGTGAIIDYQGDDCYKAGYFSLGAGIFGVGALVDLHGNDTYRGYEYCEGFSSTWGYGLVADLEGNDLYYAGGEYLHRPLLPDDYRSLSQGFSIGFRPIASGGIGLLYDKSGQDFYNGGAFAQGTSYWYSLGMLYDGSGNDFYNATEYAQGAGIHLSVGILVDREGDDHYFSRLGPAQGEGHDYSVGILIDKKGNDSYLTSGGQGIGLTNSFGLFIDEEGNDVYSTSEKTFGQGMANWSRGFGGIGIFLDLQGNDKYPRESPAENSSSWTQTVYGAGIDIKGVERAVEAEKEDEPDTIKLKTAPIADVFKEAALWEVGSARKRVKAGRAELLKRGQEAVNYIFDKKIDTKDGLELRPMEDLAKLLPDSMMPRLYKTLYNKDRWAKANAAYLLGKIKAKGSIDSLLLALKEKRLKPRAVIVAFEDIADTSTVPFVISYLKDKEEPTRIASARALAKIKDTRAIPELYNAIHDKFFTVRIAAESALVAIGDSSLKYLLTKTQDPKIISILAVLGAKLDTIDKRTERIEIQKTIIPYLENSQTSLRLKAVDALAQFHDPSLKPLLQSKMALETDEFVLEKYKEVIKGWQ